MKTKHAKAITTAEHEHMARVKQMNCGVCDAPGPSDAHHIEQGQHFTVLPLCKDCHQGSFNGWHGQKRAWLLRKLDELQVLNNTIKELST